MAPKHLLIIFFLLGTSSIKMDHLQNLIFEGIVDYFSTNLPNLASPITREEVKAYQVSSPAQDNHLKLQATVTIHKIGPDADTELLVDYRCTATVSMDEKKETLVEHINCSPAEEN